MAANLTPEQKQEIQAAFNMFDKNGDGEIAIAELGEAMAAAGQSVPEEELKQMMKAIDYNGDGKAQYNEFEAMMATQMHGCTLSDDDLKEYFMNFDENGDGFITADELKATMKAFGGRDITDEEIQAIINYTDKDRDNKLNYDEFIASMKTKM